jgi:hypothetical protein
VCLCNIHNLTSSVRGNKDNDLFCGGMVVGLGRFARFFRWNVRLVRSRQ